MPYPRRFYRTEPFDHGEMLSQPRYGFIAAAILVLLFGCLLASSNWLKPHALMFDLPREAPFDRLPEALTIVSMSDTGEVLVNDRKVSDEELRQVLRLGLWEPIEPLTRFEPHANTSYARVLEVLSIIKNSGITKFCFGNIREFRVFHKYPQPFFLTFRPPEGWDGPRLWLPPSPEDDSRLENGCDTRSAPGPLGL